MSTAIQNTDPAKWENQLALVRSMVAKDATQPEFELMLHMARTYGLDPLTKQIWLVKYGSAPASIFAGRDGFLEIGHRSGNFDGMETKVDTVEQPINRNGVNRPWQYRATCSVFCKDMKHPITVEVFEEEYTTGRNLWKDKTRTMIGKVAESQALRRAFRISGLYSPEEMPEPTEHTEKDVTPTGDAHVDSLKAKPETKAAQAKWEADTARMKALPDDIKEFFKWQKITKRDKILSVMDENHDDHDAIRSYMKGQGWQGSADLSDLAQQRTPETAGV
jgi:phage recombination protein Bet